jgi:hypothetical protein
MAWKGLDGDDQIWFASSGDGVNWTDQHAVPLAGTSDSPALAYDVNTGLLHMAWKGIPGDSGLYWSYTSDLRTWGPVVKVPGVGTSSAPTLTMNYQWFIADRLVMAWKGADDDQSLWYSRMGAKGWESQHQIGGVGSADGPALCNDLDGAARMVWRGVDGDELLWTTTLRDIYWQPQEIVQWVLPGNGGDGTIKVAHGLSAFGPTACTRLPAETHFADEPMPAPSKVFLAWHGAGDDSGLYFTQYAADTIGGDPVRAWSSQAHVPGRASSDGPSLAIFKGQLRMAWKGVDDDKGIYLSEL